MQLLLECVVRGTTRTEVENSNFLYFVISIEWSTVLKAFRRSINTAPVTGLLSRLSKILSVNCASAALVDSLDRKPNCSGGIRLLSCIYVYTCRLTIRYIILLWVGRMIICR